MVTDVMEFQFPGDEICSVNKAAAASEEAFRLIRTKVWIEQEVNAEFTLVLLQWDASVNHQKVQILLDLHSEITKLSFFFSLFFKLCLTAAFSQRRKIRISDRSVETGNRFLFSSLLQDEDDVRSKPWTVSLQLQHHSASPRLYNLLFISERNQPPIKPLLLDESEIRSWRDYKVIDVIDIKLKQKTPNVKIWFQMCKNR